MSGHLLKACNFQVENHEISLSLVVLANSMSPSQNWAGVLYQESRKVSKQCKLNMQLFIIIRAAVTLAKEHEPELYEALKVLLVFSSISLMCLWKDQIKD